MTDTRGRAIELPSISESDELELDDGERERALLVFLVDFFVDLSRSFLRLPRLSDALTDITETVSSSEKVSYPSTVVADEVVSDPLSTSRFAF